MVSYTPLSFELNAHCAEVPSDPEIDFVIEILDKVVDPALDKVELLLSSNEWDGVARNDFCRCVQNVNFGTPTNAST